MMEIFLSVLIILATWLTGVGMITIIAALLWSLFNDRR
jgi:hypothetical protein